MFKSKQHYIIHGALVLQLFSVLCGQTVPVPLDHPVNEFLMRMIDRQKIRELNMGTRPFTIEQVQNALLFLKRDNVAKHTLEVELLQRFLQEFGVLNIPQGLHALWQNKHRTELIHKVYRPFNNHEPEMRLLSFHDDQLLLWADWEEKISADFIDSHSRSFYSDRVTIAGAFDGRLSLYSLYNLYRMEYQKDEPLPDEYKQGFVLWEKNTDWLVWDMTEASVFLENQFMNLEISKVPVYWGFSKKHSPSLSAHVQPYTFFRFSKTYKNLRVQSLLGSLKAFAQHSSKSNKNIAAHRFEMDLFPDLTIAFNEMVVYANRDFEPGYFLPVNLFWSEEHSLGNKDNVLMSLDAYWSIKPGLSVYGTFFWDELSWFDIFKPWWGNKFIFQSGAHWVPFENPRLPDFRIEFTAARPWVYTHKDSLLNFTSAELGLGFPPGPNTQLLYLEMNMWPNYHSFLSLNFSLLRKGSGMGSSVNDNYALRDKDLDYKTSMLMGTISSQEILGMSYQNRITPIMGLNAAMNYTFKENEIDGRIGISLNF